MANVSKKFALRPPYLRNLSRHAASADGNLDGTAAQGLSRYVPTESDVQDSVAIAEKQRQATEKIKNDNRRIGHLS